MSETAAATPEKSINAFNAFEKFDDFKTKGAPEFWGFYLMVHVVVLILLIPYLPLFFSTADASATTRNWHAHLALLMPVIIWLLLTLIPLFAVTVRRLRATKLGSWFAVIPLIAMLAADWIALESLFMNSYSLIKLLIFLICEIPFVLIGALGGIGDAEKPAAE
ncbi:MAG: hypothetical protein J6Q65_02395 [Lentisphaeria bacterium]|nr:hypothetical protein [Lentisphaeria bacterium]